MEHPNDDLSSQLKDFKYLLRDWGHRKTSETQLQKLNIKLLSAFKNEYDNTNILFIGAGAGRIASDMADKFDFVYATDKSFSMAWHFHQILHGLSFYGIYEKNVKNIEDQTGQVDIKVTNEDMVKRVKDDYFVSDVMSLPFENDSMANICSASFSDVISQSLWLPEILRVMKQGGLFIHIGPLDYFFTDSTEMYTCKEFREEFENNGFETIIDEFVPTTHLDFEKTLIYKSHTNWFYVGKLIQKNNEILPSTVLRIINDVNFQKRIRTHSDKGTVETATLIMPNGTLFEGADSVVNILKLIDGKRSVVDILREVELIYGKISQSQEEDIYSVLKILIRNKLISIN